MDSSFRADGHKAILNKMNNKSKANRKRTNNDTKTHNADFWQLSNYDGQTENTNNLFETKNVSAFIFFDIMEYV